MRWENLPNTTTPLNKTNLEKIENIYYIPTNIGNVTGWYLALSGNIEGYDNNAFVLSIQQIDNGSSGQLYVNIRCNNSNSLELIEFKWLSNTGLNSSDFKLKLDGNDYYLYVNASLAYIQYQIKIIQQSSLQENNDNIITVNTPSASETVQEPSGANPTYSSAWRNVTLSSYLSGRAKYTKINNVVIVVFEDIKVQTNLAHGIVLASGLPKSISYENAILNNFENSQSPLRLAINTDGQIIDHYSGNTASSNNNYYGTLIYITNE